MGGREAPSSPLAAKADPAHGGEIQEESQSLHTMGAEPRHWPAGEDSARHPDEQAGILLIKALVMENSQQLSGSGGRLGVKVGWWERWLWWPWMRMQWLFLWLGQPSRSDYLILLEAASGARALPFLPPLTRHPPSILTSGHHTGLERARAVREPDHCPWCRWER